MSPGQALTEHQLELAAPVSLWRYLHFLLSGVDTECCCEHQFLEHFWQGFTWEDTKVQNSFKGNNVSSKQELKRSWSCVLLRVFLFVFQIFAQDENSKAWLGSGLYKALASPGKEKAEKFVAKPFLLIFQLFCRFNKLKYCCKYFEAFSSLITFGTLSFLTVLQRKTHYYGFCGRSSNLST